MDRSEVKFYDTELGRTNTCTCGGACDTGHGCGKCDRPPTWRYAVHNQAGVRTFCSQCAAELLKRMDAFVPVDTLYIPLEDDRG